LNWKTIKDHDRDKTFTETKTKRLLSIDSSGTGRLVHLSKHPAVFDSIHQACVPLWP
jgi:hypothetical protein